MTVNCLNQRNWSTNFLAAIMHLWLNIGTAILIIRFRVQGKAILILYRVQGLCMLVPILSQVYQVSSAPFTIQPRHERLDSLGHS